MKLQPVEVTGSGRPVLAALEVERLILDQASAARPTGGAGCQRRRVRGVGQLFCFVVMGCVGTLVATRGDFLLLA